MWAAGYQLHIFTLRSNGSPLKTPSMIVREWQVAMAINNRGGSSLPLPDEEL
jgi:hypothetical protein